MKGYYVFIIIIVIVVTNNLDCIFPQADKSIENIIEENINNSPLVTYTDKNFGFSITYPSVFVMDESPSDHTIGNVRFCYDNTAQIAIECYACMNRSAGDSDHGIGALAQAMRADMKKAEGGYILYGPAYGADGMPDEELSHYTKCLARGKLWLICSLIYPNEYAKSLGRLFEIVNSWNA